MRRTSKGKAERKERSGNDRSVKQSGAEKRINILRKIFKMLTFSDKKYCIVIGNKACVKI
jgi:hypothetical protein